MGPAAVPCTVLCCAVAEREHSLRSAGRTGNLWAFTQQKLLWKPLVDNPGAATFDLVRHRADSAALIEFYIAAPLEVLEVMRFVKVGDE